MAELENQPATNGTNNREDGIICNDDIIINDQDGLPNIHPNLKQDTDMETIEADDQLDDLPSSLIVTNIHDSVFVDSEQKREMEDLFRQYDSEVSFQWLRSFHRLRANFQTPTAAAAARMQLHQYHIRQSTITCYFAQPVTPATKVLTSFNRHLIKKRQISVPIKDAANNLKLEIQAIIANMITASIANVNSLATEQDRRINVILASTTLTPTARSCITSLKPTSAEIKASAQVSITKCLNDRFALLGTEIEVFINNVIADFKQIDLVLTCLKNNSGNAFACITIISAAATEVAIDNLATVIANLFARLINLVIKVIEDLAECDRVASKIACDAFLKKAMDVADCLLL